MATKRSQCHTYFIYKPRDRKYGHEHQHPDSSWRAPHAPTCQNTRNVLKDSVATERAHTSVYYMQLAYMLIHEHTRSVPWSSGRGPSIGAGPGRCAECSGSRLVFWFWRPVVKMTDILQGLGKLPESRWQIPLKATWDGHLMTTFLSAKALDHVRGL